MKPRLYIVTGVLIGLLATGGILLISQPERGVPIVLLPAPSATHTPLPLPSATSAPIVVYINGQVITPGTYTLEKDSRLLDLIQLAGGLTGQADVKRVNIVFLLRDGDYFYIPEVGESIPESARNAPGNHLLDVATIIEYPLNLNSASQEALETLPGIGPSKAKDIITFREQEGLFSSIDDLLKVPGIGPSILESIRNYLIIEP